MLKFCIYWIKRKIYSKFLDLFKIFQKLLEDFEFDLRFNREFFNFDQNSLYISVMFFQTKVIVIRMNFCKLKIHLISFFELSNSNFIGLLLDLQNK